MVNFCAVVGCGNRGNRDKKSFYRLPAVITREGEKTRELSQSRREKWLSHISRDIKESNLPYVRICSDHFISGKPSALYDATNPDWAPTQKLGHDKVRSSTAQDSTRYQRSMEREGKRKKLDAAAALLHLQEEIVQPEPVLSSDTEEACGTSSQTDLESSTVDAMQSEIQRILSENAKLKEELSKRRASFDRDFFEGDNDRVKYYTGLPDFATLKIVYNFVQDSIPQGSASNLTKFQKLVLCLVKLRLNVSHMDLGQKFGITKSSASRVFLDMLDILYVKLRPLIVWPEREELQQTMPMSFRTHFGTKVVVIIDCFEVFLERPSSVCARSSTWSNYKHNNTVKFLIGITPQGSISYISLGWGGRTSDKHLTENCDFLQKLNPGDVVLADRGFNISDSVGMMGAELRIPSFTRGKKQLSGREVESTRRIANVRIHVERVIGSLRQKYTILQSTIPLEFMARDSHSKLTTLDKITCVACCLTNLCPSVVPLD